MEELDKNKELAEQKLSSKELYELRKRQKEEAKKKGQRKEMLAEAPKKIGRYLLYSFVGIGVIGGLVWYIASQPPVPETEIISRSGIHWHPQLSISIKGKEQKVSANIGIGGIHAPIHTHDASGVLHVESAGPVSKENTTLRRFFKIWGKQFTSNCIFDACNGTDGGVKMFVNGAENNEFENYPMKNGDRIEIRYE